MRTGLLGRICERDELVPVGGDELPDALAGLVGGVDFAECGACGGERGLRQGVALEGEMKEGQGGRAGFALVAVDEQRARGGSVIRGEVEEVAEGFDLKERHGWVDDVEVEIEGLAEGEIVGMVWLEAAGVADGVLMAGRLAGVDDGEIGRSGPAGGEVAEVDEVGYLLRGDAWHERFAPVYLDIRAGDEITGVLPLPGNGGFAYAEEFSSEGAARGRWRIRKRDRSRRLIR